MEEKEPVVHSHITDVLPDDHPLAYKTVYCDAKRQHNCNRMLHAGNNECMTTWLEFAGKNVCMVVFAKFTLDVEHGVLSESEFLEYIEGATCSICKHDLERAGDLYRCPHCGAVGDDPNRMTPHGYLIGG
jgi:hypothetical protein